MKKRILAILAAALAGVATTSYAQSFESFDVNADGNIAKEEFLTLWKNTFDIRDANKDGDLVITDTEAVSIPIDWDTNADGKITLEEYLAARTSHFDGIDINKDGVITSLEYNKK